MVTQWGSHNALATGEKVTVVSGHCATDARPMPYSSTVIYKGKPPVLSVPAEAGPATYGMIAAGVGSASAVRLSGTSASTAQATRLTIENLLEDPDFESNKLETGGATGFSMKTLGGIGDEDERNREPTLPNELKAIAKPPIEKIGKGRASAPVSDRVSRFAPDPDSSQRLIDPFSGGGR